MKLKNEYMVLEIRSEPGNYTGDAGMRIYEDGKPWDNWHSGYADKTMIRLLEMEIRRKSSLGGLIVDKTAKMLGDKGIKTYEVEPCPTGHANATDDFMGGMVCLDCRCVW